jgi:hypothetical protein
MIPSGFAAAEASFARNLFGATPTEHTSSSSSRTRARISSPILAGSPKSEVAPPTSRNASSRDRGSTSGVNESMISRSRTLAARYAGKSGGTNTACGASRFARAAGIAEEIPNRRAS